MKKDVSSKGTFSLFFNVHYTFQVLECNFSCLNNFAPCILIEQNLVVRTLGI